MRKLPVGVTSEMNAYKAVRDLSFDGIRYGIMEEVGVVKEETEDFQKAMHWLCTRGHILTVRDKQHTLHRFIPGAPASHPDDLQRLCRIWHRTNTSTEIL